MPISAFWLMHMGFLGFCYHDHSLYDTYVRWMVGSTILRVGVAGINRT